MKQFLRIILVLAAVLLPNTVNTTTASAEVYFTFCGREATGGGTLDLSKINSSWKGTLSYDVSTSTLTLDNVTLSTTKSDQTTLYLNKSITIHVKGTCNLSSQRRVINTDKEVQVSLYGDGIYESILKLTSSSTTYASFCISERSSLDVQNLSLYSKGGYGLAGVDGEHYETISLRKCHVVATSIGDNAAVGDLANLVLWPGTGDDRRLMMIKSPDQAIFSNDQHGVVNSGGKLYTKTTIVFDYMLPINEETFPDEKFRRLAERDFGKISIHEDPSAYLRWMDSEKVDTYNKIDIDRDRHGLVDKVSNLKGIEYFYNLETLDCSGHQLTSLDLSKNTKLTKVACSNNRLTSLNVSSCKSLKDLECRSNELEQLDVTNNTLLESLYCKSNKLTQLNLTNNKALSTLDCPDNPLSVFDVSSHKNLTFLNCSGISILTTLDVSNNTMLEQLVCDHCSNLTELDLTHNTSLRILDCEYDRKLTTLNLTKNTKLETLLINNCTGLTSIDLSKNTMLEYLFCSYISGVKDLDLSANTKLKKLDYSDNIQMQVLNMPKTTLKILVCRRNQLETLDVSEFSNLETLDCASNNLKTLDLSNLTKLKEIVCFRNQINISGMNSLINSLVNRTGSNSGTLCVHYDNPQEQNVCTVEQVKAAKNKNWIVKYTTDTADRINYAGVTIPIATAVNNVQEQDHDAWSGNDAVYNLQGQRVSAPRKGIHIINGKKVVIK